MDKEPGTTRTPRARPSWTALFALCAMGLWLLTAGATVPLRGDDDEHEEGRKRKHEREHGEKHDSHDDDEDHSSHHARNAIRIQPTPPVEIEPAPPSASAGAPVTSPGPAADRSPIASAVVDHPSAVSAGPAAAQPSASPARPAPATPEASRPVEASARSLAPSPGPPDVEPSHASPGPDGDSQPLFGSTPARSPGPARPASPPKLRGRITACDPMRRIAGEASETDEAGNVSPEWLRVELLHNGEPVTSAQANRARHGFEFRCAECHKPRRRADIVSIRVRSRDGKRSIELRPPE